MMTSVTCASDSCTQDSSLIITTGRSCCWLGCACWQYVLYYWVTMFRYKQWPVFLCCSLGHSYRRWTYVMTINCINFQPFITDGLNYLETCSLITCILYVILYYYTSWVRTLLTGQVFHSESVSGNTMLGLTILVLVLLAMNMIVVISVIVVQWNYHDANEDFESKNAIEVRDDHDHDHY